MGTASPPGMLQPPVEPGLPRSFWEVFPDCAGVCIRVLQGVFRPQMVIPVTTCFPTSFTGSGYYSAQLMSWRMTSWVTGRGRGQVGSDWLDC